MNWSKHHMCLGMFSGLFLAFGKKYNEKGQEVMHVKLIHQSVTQREMTKWYVYGDNSKINFI